MTSGRQLALAAQPLLMPPAAAGAQLVDSGPGLFLTGVLHLLLSPSDLLALAAVALLAGLGGLRVGRWMMLALPAAWLVGGHIGLSLETAGVVSGLSVGLVVLAAMLVAADLQLPPPAALALAVLVGALRGMLDGASLAAGGAGPVAVLGAAVMVQLIGLLVVSVVASLHAASGRIAVRVAGSWIVAVGMLMTGQMLHGTTG
jgi:hypothetical protein